MKIKQLVAKLIFTTFVAFLFAQTNSMVLVEGGTFQMGSNMDPADAQTVLNKMKELGACWSVTNGIVNYYTQEEGAYSVYMKDLIIQ